MKTKRKTNAHLPDPFKFDNGKYVRTAEDWRRRRKEIFNSIVGIEYGGLPPAPAFTRGETLHTSKVKRLGDVKFISIRVTAEAERPFSFMLYLLVPTGDGPFPVVVTGDACWRYVTDEIAAEVIRREKILAQFNRVEIAPDTGSSDRSTGLYLAYPRKTFGALSAWAWGYHRCVDVLTGMDFVDSSKIAVVGHSRGGKTALLAGATDERIALTSANDSGAGGAGCYRMQGPKSEMLSDCIRAFSYWYGPRLKEFIGRETELPFDQHFLKALVAPRALLTTEALGDLWANPTGTWQTHLAAREVYKFLGAEEKIGIWHREGGHSHTFADWNVLLDFMDWQFHGRRSSLGFNSNPLEKL